MQKLLPIVVISVFFTSEATAQSTGDAKPYHVEEAYKVYGLVLPHEESYGFAKDMLKIRRTRLPKTSPRRAWRRPIPIDSKTPSLVTTVFTKGNGLCSGIFRLRSLTE
jgi:hypothetical protein